MISAIFWFAEGSQPHRESELSSSEVASYKEIKEVLRPISGCARGVLPFVTICDHDFRLVLAGTASVAFLVRGVCQEPRATNDFRMAGQALIR